MTSPAPATATPSRKAGCLRPGCIVALVLAAGSCGWAWWRITLPGRLAASSHALIRPGMTTRDVIAAAEQYWDVTGSRCAPGIDSFQVFTPGRIASGYVMLRRTGAKGTPDQEDLRFDGKAALLRLFDERPELRGCHRLGFTFLVMGVPPRSSFAVELGDDGRVVSVTAPHSWD